MFSFDGCLWAGAGDRRAPASLNLRYLLPHNLFERYDIRVVRGHVSLLFNLLYDGAEIVEFIDLIHISTRIRCGISWLYENSCSDLSSRLCP